MKHILLLLLLISFYGFWQWLDRHHVTKAYKLEELTVSKEAPVRVKLSAQRREKKHLLEKKEIALTNNLQKSTHSSDDLDAEEKYNRGRDSLLVVLSDSGVDLDDIATALNEIQHDDEMTSDEYLDELMYLLPNQSREILESLIERKIIFAEHFKEFFDKFINSDMNSMNEEPRRYPGYDTLDYERVEY